MSKLVVELKQDHQQMTDMLVELRKPGISPTKRMDLLLQSKTLFLDHLKKEDDQLYPPLHDKAQSHVSFKLTLNTFGKEMDRITEFVFDFYQKYLDVADVNKTQFTKDVSTFVALLKNRMMREEVAIYKAYDKLELE